METRVVAGSAGTSSGHTDLSNEHPDVELAHGQARIRKQTSQAKRQSSGVPLGLRQCPLNRRDSLGAFAKRNACFTPVSRLRGQVGCFRSPFQIHAADTAFGRSKSPLTPSINGVMGIGPGLSPSGE